MIKNSIFFYTNNVVPKEILERSLSGCLSFVEDNQDTELIITSHLPLTKEYEDVSEKFDNFLDRRLSGISTKLSLDINNPRVFPYVVGELPHCVESIIDQIRFSLKCAKGENIIMMEHDVFYPSDYFQIVVSELNKGYDFVFAKSHLLFCHSGFSEGVNNYPLSRFSGKKTAWSDLYDHIALNKLAQVEPSLKGIGEIEERGLIEVENYKIYEGGDPVLDITHGLNTSGKAINPNFYDTDDYWGSKDELLSLFDKEYVTFVIDHPIFHYGLHAVS